MAVITTETISNAQNSLTNIEVLIGQVVTGLKDGTIDAPSGASALEAIVIRVQQSKQSIYELLNTAMEIEANSGSQTSNTELDDFNVIRKFREVNADKIIYMDEGHTAELPRLVTITSTLPVPRKGNPGTVKTLVNIRRSVILDAGKSTERTAPMIVKVETSFPLGTDVADRSAIRRFGASALMQSDSVADRLFYNGLLPQD